MGFLLLGNINQKNEATMKLSVGDFIIRSWQPGDAKSLQKYANNRKIWYTLRDFFPHPYTLQDAIWWIENSSKELPERSYAIATAEEPIGGIGLIFGEDVHRFSAELGYWLAEPFWNRGIMTSVVCILTEYAFHQFPINRVFAEPFADNLASARVLEKAGYHQEGILTASVVKDGKVQDQFIYAKQNQNFILP